MREYMHVCPLQAMAPHASNLWTAAPIRLGMSPREGENAIHGEAEIRTVS